MILSIFFFYLHICDSLSTLVYEVFKYLAQYSEFLNSLYRNSYLIQNLEMFSTVCMLFFILTEVCFKERELLILMKFDL